MFNSIKTRTIKANGALILVTSLITYLIAYIGLFDEFYFVRLIGLSCLYIVLALFSDDYRGIGEMFDQVWKINQTSIPDDEKLELIRNFLEAATADWYHYWLLFQTTANGLAPHTKKAQKIGDIFKRITKGEISLFQGLWIFMYLVYSILLSSGVVAIEGPYDIILSIGFLLIILFASGNIKGITKFLEEIFRALKVENADQIKGKLRVIESLIMNASKNYYFITCCIDAEELTI